MNGFKAGGEKKTLALKLDRGEKQGEFLFGGDLDPLEPLKREHDGGYVGRALQVICL